jgi:uncharacterized phiE125 gp8 family phage protein
MNGSGYGGSSGGYGYGYDWHRYAFTPAFRRRGVAVRWAVTTAPSSPAPVEPLQPADLIALARIVSGDEETTLLPGYISAARQYVEQDTGRALIEAVLDLYADALPADQPVLLPWPPLQSVQLVEWTDVDGTTTTVDPSTYIVDAASAPARLAWVDSTTVPRTVQTFQGWHVQQRVGWTSALLPPLLRQAIGLLAAHWLTTGRDLTVIGAPVADMPYGYATAVAPYRLEVLA